MSTYIGREMSRIVCASASTNVSTHMSTNVSTNVSTNLVGMNVIKSTRRNESGLESESPMAACCDGNNDILECTVCGDYVIK